MTNGKITIHGNEYPYELYNTITIAVKDGDIDVIKNYLNIQKENKYHVRFYDAPSAKLCKITHDDVDAFIKDVVEAWAADTFVSKEVDSLFNLLTDVLSACDHVDRIGCIELVEDIK